MGNSERVAAVSHRMIRRMQAMIEAARDVADNAPESPGGLAARSRLLEAVDGLDATTIVQLDEAMARDGYSVDGVAIACRRVSSGVGYATRTFPSREERRAGVDALEPHQEARVLWPMRFGQLEFEIAGAPFSDGSVAVAGWPAEKEEAFERLISGLADAGLYPIDESQALIGATCPECGALCEVLAPMNWQRWQEAGTRELSDVDGCSWACRPETESDGPTISHLGVIEGGELRVVRLSVQE